MFRPLPFFIGVRYTRARRRSLFVSFISLTSIIGLALGVLVMIVVLSVMNGFDREMRDRVLGMVPHATLDSTTPIKDWRTIGEGLLRHPQVAAIAPFTQMQGLLTNNGQVQKVLVNAIDPVEEAKVSIIGDYFREGSLDSLQAGGFGILIGDLAAKKLGLSNSHFGTSNGWPDNGVTYVTARDLATLARYLIVTFPEYYRIYSEKEFTFNGIKQGNRNALLYTDPSVDGLKTGHTDEAGYCLTTSSKRGPMRLISVIFGTPSMNERASQTRTLLAWGFANFETANVQPANQVLAKAKVWFGKEDNVQIGLAENFNVTMPKGQADKIKTQLVVQPKLNAPLAKGQVVGKLVASLDGKIIAEKPLVALKPVEEASFFARLIDHIKMFFSNLF